MALMACSGAPPQPASCRQSCVTPHGALLGANSGVEAYSNCSAACVDPTPHHHGGVYTGIRWQCVEYARRWWLVEAGVVFGSVDTADDMWRTLTEARRPESGDAIEITRHPNGGAEPPRRGDLLIFAKDPTRQEMRFGHVAVVVGVDLGRGHVELAEQNMGNAAWTSPESHTRALPLEGDKDGYRVGGEDRVYGWLRAL